MANHGPSPPTLQELAELVQGRLRDGDPNRRVTGVAPVDEAGPDDITWATSVHFARQLASSRAGAAIVPERCGPTPMPAILCGDVEDALSRVLGRFHVPYGAPPAGAHPTAVVLPEAEIGADAAIGPHVVIGRGARVGAGSQLHAGVHVGDAAVIGERCVLHPGAYVGDRCTLGDRVVLKPGAVIGSDGFGYNFRRGGHQRIPHIGVVIIEDDVEIGANSCVDRSKFGVTRIGRGTKIDNLVQVAHNCVIGPHCILAGQVGIAGSVRIGAGVVFGGQSGSVHGVSICDGVQIGAQSCVTKDIETRGTYSGFPARPHIAALRSLAGVERAPELVRQIEQLSRRIAELEAAMHHRENG